MVVASETSAVVVDESCEPDEGVVESKIIEVDSDESDQTPG